MKISITVITYLAIAWVSVAFLVGRFRHPWMSETEILLNMSDLMQFKTIDTP